MRRISLFLAVLLFFPTFAQAKDDAAKTASRALLRQGNERLDKEKFDQALEKFEQAYARFPSPKILFSMGQALRGLKRNADALRAFLHFVDETGEIAEEIRKEAQTNIAELSVLVNQELTGQAGQPGQAGESSGAREQLLTQGLAFRGLGRNVDAIVAFERFLAESKAATVQDQEDRKEAHDNIAKLTPLVGRVEITSNRPGATAVMDGQALPAVTLPRSLWVAPGDHQVTLEWQGDKTTAAFEVAAGQSVALLGLNFAEPLPAPVIVPPAAPVVSIEQTAPPPSHSWRRSTWVWIGAGAVVAAVGTGLLWIYGRRDHYPSTGLGSQTIGGGP
jgi:hypothetical protein